MTENNETVMAMEVAETAAEAVETVRKGMDWTKLGKYTAFAIGGATAGYFGYKVGSKLITKCNAAWAEFQEKRREKKVSKGQEA